MTAKEKAEQLANQLVASGASRSLVEAFSAAIIIATMEAMTKGLERELEEMPKGLERELEEMPKGLERELDAINNVIDDMKKILQSNHWG